MMSIYWMTNGVRVDRPSCTDGGSSWVSTTARWPSRPGARMTRTTGCLSLNPPC